MTCREIDEMVEMLGISEEDIEKSAKLLEDEYRNGGDINSALETIYGTLGD